MFKVNKSSWHYRFLTWYTVTTKRIKPVAIRQWKSVHDKDGHFLDGFYETVGHDDPYKTVWTDYYNLPTNFCQYWRRTIINPLIRIGFNIGSYVAAGVLLAKAYSLSGFGGFYITGIMLAVILLAGAVFFGLCFMTDKVNLNIKKKLKKFFIEADDDTLIGMAIKTHKDKVCVGVEYDNE